jgi:hypothetical protein
MSSRKKRAAFGDGVELVAGDRGIGLGIWKTPSAERTAKRLRVELASEDGKAAKDRGADHDVCRQRDRCPEAT